MTNQEFSNEFDILYNNIMSNQALGLDEFEKSVFLTKAQEEIVVSLYNGSNPLGLSFELTEQLRRALKDLLKTYTVNSKESGYTGVSTNSIFYKLPEDVWFITYEAVNLDDSKYPCSVSSDILVTPISLDEYLRVKNNPFRGSSDRRAIRLDYNGQIVELISKYQIGSYTVKYLSRPTPIILLNLPDGLSINGINKETECRLNSSLHRVILERAVEIAKFSWLQTQLLSK